MSVLSTLALLVTAGVKWKPNREAELAGEIVGLKIDLADARRERDDWQARADAWRERALANIPAVVALPQPAGPDFRPPHIALQQAAALQQMQARHENQVSQNLLAQYAHQQGLAQSNMQMAAQNAMGYGQGLMLSAQAINPELWCNCVPSRAQVWAANGAEA